MESSALLNSSFGKNHFSSSSSIRAVLGLSKEDKTIEAEAEVKKDVVVEQLQETSDSTDNNIITTDNITSEIGKMKQQLFTGINNIQDELNSENSDNPQVTTYMQPDPVDQIRRYYELKEDGIITEEEFELKKKQLLDL